MEPGFGLPLEMPSTRLRSEERRIPIFSFTNVYGHFEYAIPVDAGIYALSLHFAEAYFGPANEGGGGAGSRVFDVFCNGAVLLRNFDIFREAGMNRALIKTFHGLIPNAQGKLVVTFVPVKNYASLYALEVADETQ
jgi:hypothetical protein